MGFFRSLFGLGGGATSDTLREALAGGALILDVRTPAEYARGHVAGSRNIAVQQLGSRLAEVKAWRHPVVVCCRSGARSSRAESLLRAAGVEVINGGTWQHVDAAANAS